MFVCGPSVLFLCVFVFLSFSVNFSSACFLLYKELVYLYTPVVLFWLVSSVFVQYFFVIDRISISEKFWVTDNSAGKGCRGRYLSLLGKGELEKAIILYNVGRGLCTWGRRRRPG